MSAVAQSGSVFVLVATIGMVGVCTVGMVRSRDPFSRLHFTGAAALFGPSGLAVALSLADGTASTVLRAWLIATIALLTSAIMTHATARAELLRRESGGEAPDEERG